jgi:hypothetical protein
MPAFLKARVTAAPTNPSLPVTNTFMIEIDRAQILQK